MKRLDTGTPDGLVIHGDTLYRAARVAEAGRPRPEFEVEIIALAVRD